MMVSAHVPVLLQEAVEILAPAPGKRIVDGTYGFGGHSDLLLERGAEVLGLDLDEDAIAECEQARARRPRLQCRKSSYRYLAGAIADLGWSTIDGVLLDLGVNSQQLDEPHKGFSYRRDGPLDLRFDRGTGRPASELLADLDEVALAKLLQVHGEVRGSRRLARAIVQAVNQVPITTTARLREVVTVALPRGSKPEPILSRVFQALRIAVNDELECLRDALQIIPACLVPGGRVVVIAYHSLEDRLVKQWLDLESKDCICPPTLPACRCDHRRSLKILTKRAVRPTESEERENRRSRSARLRAAEKLTEGEAR
jgi:16S rRNA (cytosine1402-N4)-methyltransferase